MPIDIRDFCLIFPTLPVLDSPLITTNTSQVTLVENTATARLQCQAVGDPEPSIRWTQPYNSTVMAGNSDGSLTLTNIQAATHAGVYQCIASNVWGNDTMTVTVNVVGELYHDRHSQCSG